MKTQDSDAGESRTLAQFLESAPDAMVVVGKDGVITLANAQTERLFGHPRDQLIGQSVEILIPARLGADHRRHRQAYAAKPSRRPMGSGMELFGQHADGTEFPVEISLAPVETGDGQVTIAAVRDITGRKKDAGLLRQLVESAPDAMVIVDARGTIRLVNGQTERVFGQTRDALIGRPVEALIPERLNAVHRVHRERYTRGPALRGMGAGMGKLLGRRPDGTEFPIEISLSPIETRDGLLICAAIRDITDRQHEEERRLSVEASLQHAQKLESLGVMAGGVAHDFNNLLVGVLANAELVEAELPPDFPLRAQVQDIQVAAERAADLCLQLLAYAGKARVELQPTDLSGLVRDMLHLIEVAVSRDHRVSFALDSDLPLILVDGTQVRQVIMNLVLNAAEAINDRTGHISVTTTIRHFSQDYLRACDVAAALEAGPYVVLSVRDDGAGMSDEVRCRIFEPFFTTKFTGRGIGLASVLGIVRAQGGAIHVESQLGRGTCFDVLFPLDPEQTTRETSADAAGLRHPAVLVVDDEQVVRSVASVVLERAGLPYLVAQSGPEALEILRAHADEIGVVLLDLSMPGMNGAQCLHLMREEKFEVEVILCSGYEEHDATRTVTDQYMGFVQKPWRVRTLLAEIRRALETHSRGEPVTAC
ncbi:sensory box histidine kinase/response regulator [Enhygromyxa salina]|uniref:histidine kinase n=1 Tax=Enhygromyxa salina TaxID=215803 RepID=A0A0C1ZCA5_9BACT|nr:PAS domain S-box protein [Enhygromyxa salina]KIG15319.1 sensory box histidine kinase/response regulator [Enhygromyxa salina]